MSVRFAVLPLPVIRLIMVKLGIVQNIKKSEKPLSLPDSDPLILPRSWRSFVWVVIFL